MAAGRRIAELASEPWQIGHGRTLCEKKYGQASNFRQIYAALFITSGFP